MLTSEISIPSIKIRPDSGRTNIVSSMLSPENGLDWEYESDLLVARRDSAKVLLPEPRRNQIFFKIYGDALLPVRPRRAVVEPAGIRRDTFDKEGSRCGA